VVNRGGKLGDGELATPIGGWNIDKVLVLFFEARGGIPNYGKIITKGLK
jgi:hypothetical protein